MKRIIKTGSLFVLFSLLLSLAIGVNVFAADETTSDAGILATIQQYSLYIIAALLIVIIVLLIIIIVKSRKLADYRKSHHSSTHHHSESSSSHHSNSEHSSSHHHSSSKHTEPHYNDAVALSDIYKDTPEKSEGGAKKAASSENSTPEIIVNDLPLDVIVGDNDIELLGNDVDEEEGIDHIIMSNKKK